MHKKLNKILTLCIVALSTVVCVYAQSKASLENMSSTELRNNANSLIDQGQYVMARPYMEVLIGRMEQTDPSQLESMYFFMGYSYVQEYVASKSASLLDAAIPFFEKVIEKWPGGVLATQSIELKATSLNGLGRFEEAAETWGLKLKPPYVDNLNYAQRAAVLRKVAQAFYTQGNWEKGTPWFNQLYTTARTLDDKTYAAVALIRAYLSEGNYEEARKFYSDLTNPVPSRYDIYLSMDFLKAGDALAEQKNYAEASLCYTFVQTKEEITEFMIKYAEYLEKQIKRLKGINPNDPRLPDLENKFSYSSQLAEALGKVDSYTSQLLARMARNYFETKRNFESFWAYRQLLDDYPNDENIEKNYFAAFITAVELQKEKQIDALANEYREKFPDGEFIKSLNIQFALFLLKSKQFDRFFQVATEALANDPDDEDLAPQYIFLMGRHLLEQKDYTTLETMFTEFAKNNPTSPAAAGAYYWMMMSHLVRTEYDEALPYATKLLDEYPGSLYDEDATYRRAVAVFGQGKVSESKTYFNEFIEKFKHSGTDLIGEAEQFLGDIFFIEQNFEQSYIHYMNVPDVTQKPSLVNSAYMHAASMLESAGMFDKQAETLLRYIKNYPEADGAMAAYMLTQPLFKQGLSADAVRGYMNAIKKYGMDPKNDSVDKIIANFQTFYNEAKIQMDATAEFLQRAVDDRKFLEMLVTKAGERYQFTLANPDVNPNVYAMFKIQMDKDEAVFGPALLKDKAPLEALLKMYRDQQKKFPRESPQQFFEATLKEARANNHRLLENRMLMALDEIGKLTERPNMFADDEFKGMSYKVLVWMGKSNERYDIESARRALQQVIDSDTDYRLDALFALAELEERAQLYEQALLTFKTAEDDFPTDDRAPRAAIKQAELLLKIGQEDKAVEKLLGILSVPVWPAKIQAEVTYKLGSIEKNRGNNKMAIMYFDRCALSYSDIHEFSAPSVLEGAKLAMIDGNKEQAIEFLKTFLDDVNNKNAPQYEEIKAYYGTIR